MRRDRTTSSLPSLGRRIENIHSSFERHAVKEMIRCCHGRVAKRAWSLVAVEVCVVGSQELQNEQLFGDRQEFTNITGCLTGCRAGLNARGIYLKSITTSFAPKPNAENRIHPSSYPHPQASHGETQKLSSRHSLLSSLQPPRSKSSARSP